MKLTMWRVVVILDTYTWFWRKRVFIIFPSYEKRNVWPSGRCPTQRPDAIHFFVNFYILKLISSPYCALSRVCLRLLFCFMQDVTKCSISHLLTWSKFKLSCQPPFSTRSFMLHSSWYIAWLIPSQPVKINEDVGKRVWKDKVCDS